MPFFNHLEEIKIRFIYVLTSFLITFVISYLYSTELFYIVIYPLSKTQYTDNFIYTNMVEIIYLYIKISLCASLYLTLPILLYHIWNFFSSGLYPYENHIWSHLILLFFFMFALASFLYYFYFLPFIWDFLLNFQIMEASVNIKLYAKITEYFHLFVLLFLIAFLLIISPLVNFLFLSKENFHPKYFHRNRKYYYFLSTLLVLLISPPEVMSQVLLLIPTWIFYEILIFQIILQYTYYFKRFKL